MTKKLLIAATFLLLSLALISCQVLETALGLEGLAGFDSASEKALDMGFEQIDWLEGDELKAQIAELCKSGRLGVEYSDRLRGLEFTSMTSPIRVRVFNNRVELRHNWNYAWSEREGWWNPKGLVFECYGEKVSEPVASSDVIVTNDSFYDEYLKETVYTRSEEIDHILSAKASEFIYKNWTNNDLYIQVVGNRSDYHKVKNADLANLYRLVYDTLFPYTALAVATDEEVAEIIGSLGTISKYDAEAIVFNLSQNENYTAEKVSIIANLVNSKIK